jgi:hypothetical protein
MSEAQALAAALVFADHAKAYPRRALRAELTQPGRPKPCARLARSTGYRDHAPRVWVVTFTSPKPVDVSQGRAPVYVTHYSVAVNAVTGTFVLGFFER